jgi:hypothetical protein
MTYPDLVPKKPTEAYIPKVFGFKIHDSSLCISRNRGGSTNDELLKKAGEVGGEISTNFIELRHLTSLTKEFDVWGSSTPTETEALTVPAADDDEDEEMRQNCLPEVVAVNTVLQNGRCGTDDNETAKKKSKKTEI